jgi:hypothetical protein
MLFIVRAEPTNLPIVGLALTMISMLALECGRFVGSALTMNSMLALECMLIIVRAKPTIYHTREQVC